MCKEEAVQPFADEREPRSESRSQRRTSIIIAITVVAAITLLIVLHLTGVISPPTHGTDLR